MGDEGCEVGDVAAAAHSGWGAPVAQGAPGFARPD